MSEQKLGAIFALLPFGIIILNERFRIVYHNSTVCRILGLSPDELCRHSYVSYQFFEADGTPIPPEHYPSRQAVAEQRPIYDVETRAVRPDGSELWISCSAVPIGLPGWAALAIVVDISARKRAEQALRESEARFRQLAESLPQLVWTATPDGRCDYLSPQWIVYTGVPAAAQLGYGWLDQVHPDDRESVRAAWGDALSSGRAHRVENRLRRDDGVFRWFAIHGVPLRDSQGQIVKWFGISSDIEDQKQAEAELRRYAEQQQQFAQRLVAAQEAERRAIARELHDEVGQTLTGLKLLLDTGDALPAEQLREQLAEARRTIGELLGRVRNLSLALHPSMLDDLGLLPALSWLIERYSAQTGVHVSWRAQGVARRFATIIETSVYRIAQEALTNVARHAGVGSLELRLLADDEQLLLQIDDEGRGFDVAAAMRAHQSIGLIGMHERVELLGGTLLIESAPGQGTHLSASIPLTPAAATGSR